MIEFRKYLDPSKYKTYISKTTEAYKKILVDLEALEASDDKSFVNVELGKLTNKMNELNHEVYFSEEFDRACDDAYKIQMTRPISSSTTISFDAPKEYWRVRIQIFEKFNKIFKKFR